MKKEEYIAKYGEEAYAKRCEQSRLWRKQKYDNDPEFREKIKARNHVNIDKWKKTHKRFNKRYSTDLSYKEYKQKYSEKSRLKFKTEMGDVGIFAATQISVLSRDHIEDLDKYILENLTKEAAEVDGDHRLTNEDFLYECFVKNCKYGLFYGNLQIIKYFVPLMCVKVHKNIEFNDKNIEMIKVFDGYRNTLNKKPIAYTFKMYYIHPEQKADQDKTMKCMLLYNLSADFMHNRSRYVTDKKLY